MIGHPFTSPASPDTGSQQAWLRRRIATLKSQQAARIALTEQAKKDMDESILKAQREIDNLEAQVTIR